MPASEDGPLAVWRNLWDDSSDLAETAYSFMASRLTDN